MVDVLYLAPIFPPYDKPGSPVYFENLVRELSTDHRVHVAAPFSRSAPLIECDGDVIVYRFILRNDGFPAPIRAFLEVVSAFLLSFGLLLAKPIDVCHVQSTSYPTISFALSASVMGTPLYYDCRDENFLPWLITKGPVIKWFSCSSSIDEQLINCGVPKENIVRLPVINPPYVSDYAREPGLREGTGFNVIFIGRLLEKKGILQLAKGFAQFETDKQDISLIYVGDGDHKSKLKKEIKRLNIETNTTLTGKVPHRGALDILSKSDVLVLPSSDEGIPRVIVEAFEIGVPVIATPAGGIEEIVRDRETGFLTKPTPQAIAGSLNMVYNEVKLSEEVANNARNYNNSRGWSKIREDISEAYSIVS